MPKGRIFLETYIRNALPKPEKALCIGRAMYYPFNKPFVLKISFEINSNDDIYGVTICLLHKVNGTVDNMYVSFTDGLGLGKYSASHKRWWGCDNLPPNGIIIDSIFKPLIKDYLKVWGLLEEG